MAEKKPEARPQTPTSKYPIISGVRVLGGPELFKAFDRKIDALRRRDGLPPLVRTNSPPYYCIYEEGFKLNG